MKNSNIVERQVGDVAVLDVSGKLKGCGGRGLLREAISHPLEERHNKILVNLARVTRIDSSCPGVLVSIHFDLSRSGALVKIIRLSNHLRELITISDIQRVSDSCMYESESEALQSFKGKNFDLVEFRRILKSGIILMRFTEPGKLFLPLWF